MNLNVMASYLIINSYKEPVSKLFLDEVEKTGLDVIGFVPHDRIVPEYDIEKMPLIELPDTSPVVVAINKIGEKLFKDQQYDK
jgi:CO dehydrogenase maturation factor